MRTKSQQIKTPEARILNLERELNWALMKIRVLEEQLRQERIRRMGPHSEKLSDLQLELLQFEPLVTVDEVEAEAGRSPFPAPAPGPDTVQDKPKAKAHPGRQKFSASLRRVTETIACPPELCQCPACGAETAVIGHDESEMLDVEPAAYFVRVTRREKRACRRCEQGTVVAAPVEPRIVEKGLASDRIVIDTVVAKYCDHLPLYRQAAMLEREAGLEISRATLDGWVMRVGELLIPVVESMRRDLLEGTYLQADETTVGVQTHDKRGSNHEAWLWQYGRPGGETVFDFRMGRDRDGPRKFLGRWEGILQSDGYKAYDEIGGPKLLHVGCWAHARRKFVDAVKLNPRDVNAVRMVASMDALFRIEAEARASGLTSEARLVLRRERSGAVALQIHNDCLMLAKRELPQSAVRKGATYLLNQWTRLNRCLEYGEVEISNNMAENSMRPVALGRKNWLHVGSEAAGAKVAAMLSVVESCRRLGLPVKQYLAEVLPGLNHKLRSEVRLITPRRWAASRSSGL
ncbi:MAG: IS66 family transposase [Acidobacteriia bacterium]|nr:IS66 family transposase [Terriglobia bacterium]